MMSDSIINPKDLVDSKPLSFSHGVIQTKPRTLHASGQVAWDKDFNVVGEGDWKKQTEQVLKNIQSILDDAGARREDVLTLRSYAIDPSEEAMGIICSVLGEFFGPDYFPAHTLVGVSWLAKPGLKIEIECTIQID